MTRGNGSIRSVGIVGGGGAGCITALTLQHAHPELDVTVYEREPEAHTTLCAEGISHKTLALFDAFDSTPHCAQRFAGASWWFPGPVEVLVDQPCYTIERSTWIPAMAEAIEKRDGRYETGRKIRPNEVEGLAGEHDLVIGADGPGSQVRKAIGGEATTRLGVQIRLQAPWSGDRLMFYTHKAFSPEYAWIFPKGDILNVGILGEGDGKDWDRIEAFREWIGLKEGTIVKKEAYPIAFDGTRLAQGNIALVGDAAGLTNPLTKGGLAAIIHSAQLLSAAVGQAREKGLEGSAATRAYAQAVADHPISDPSYDEALDVMLRWSNEDFERLARFAPSQVTAGGSIKEKLLLALGMATNPTKLREVRTLYRAMSLSKGYSW